MYTILVKNDDTLIATNKQNIMHRSSLVRQLRFLVDPVYASKGLKMADYDCILEYRTPISNRYTPVVLAPSEELYKEKLEYVLNIDTKITGEVGLVEMQLKWMTVDMLANGSFEEAVRITGSTTIEVLPTNKWSDYIASSDLDPIVQMVLTNQAQAEQLKLYADYLMMTKADGIKYDAETNELSLMGDGNKLDSVTLENGNCDCEDGIPVVDFDKGIIPTEPDEFDNVVEF
jgi:hypothetical protein